MLWFLLFLSWCRAVLHLMCVFIFLVNFGCLSGHLSENSCSPDLQYVFLVKLPYAALTYTEYPLRILKFEIRAEITEYDANGRGGAGTKRCLCESVKNACGSLQIS